MICVPRIKPLWVALLLIALSPLIQAASVTVASASASPNTVGPNGQTTFSVSLLSQGTIAGTTVTIQLLDPTGTQIIRKWSWSNQYLASNQIKQFQFGLSVPTSTPGIYHFAVGVYGADSATYLWAPNVATVSVVVPGSTPPAAPKFTLLSTTSSAASAYSGQSTNLAASLTVDIAASNVTILFDLRDSSGAQIIQQWPNPNQTFAAGQVRSYNFSFSVPDTLAPGQYKFGVKVLDTAGQVTYLNNASIATLSVTAAPPTFSVTSSDLSPTSVAAGRSATLTASLVSSANVNGILVAASLLDSTGTREVQSWSYPNQTFLKGQAGVYNFAFPVSASLTPGQYLFALLIRDSTGQITYLSRPAIATLTVLDTISLLNGIPSPSPIQAPYTCVSNYYVAKTGSDSNAGSNSAPWLTISRAVSVLQSRGPAQGGVCVNVSPGVYTEAVYANGFGGSSDSATGYLVFRSTTPGGASVQVPLSRAADGTAAAFRFDSARFIVIDGFELLGYVVPGSMESGVVTNAWGPPGHHIKILNNRIHDHGGAGVGAVHTDYLVVQGNIVYSTSNTSSYQVSGISSWQAVASDSAPGFHNVISHNVLFNNMEVNTNHTAHSDGNGIIIDDFRNSQNGSAYGSYKSETLVAYNLSFGNGGAGIKVFFSDRVSVINNTVFGNDLDLANPATWRGEIIAVNSSGSTFRNNIARADPTRNSYNNSIVDASIDNSNIGNVWTNNLTFNGTSSPSTMLSGTLSVITSAAGNLLGRDPRFTNPASRDFSLQPGSPAIGTGINVAGVTVQIPPNLGALP